MTAERLNKGRQSKGQWRSDQVNNTQVGGRVGGGGGSQNNRWNNNQKVDPRGASGTTNIFPSGKFTEQKNSVRNAGGSVPVHNSISRDGGRPLSDS